MPELLIELFSEEIPARMQAKAADDLLRKRRCWARLAGDLRLRRRAIAQEGEALAPGVVEARGNCLDVLIPGPPHVDGAQAWRCDCLRHTSLFPQCAQAIYTVAQLNSTLCAHVCPSLRCERCPSLWTILGRSLFTSLRSSGVRACA